MSQKKAGVNLSDENIKSTLENFVAETAMLSLETEPSKTEKKQGNIPQAQQLHPSPVLQHHNFWQPGAATTKTFLKT